MSTIPKTVTDRLVRQVPRFQKILKSALERDCNESDTVIVVTDILADLFGYEKYSEVTSEQAIRGTYCDLAVQIDGGTQYLIEVKAIGLKLKDNHLRQAVNYGANEGVPWVVLTNGIHWQVYRINFERPISHEFVLEFDFLKISAKDAEDLEKLFSLCRAGMTKSVISRYHERGRVINRYVLAELIQLEVIVLMLRREFKRMMPTSRVTTAEITSMLPTVLKRDVLEGEDVARARKLVRAASGRKLLNKRKPPQSSR